MGDLITIFYHHGGSFVTKNDGSVFYETDNTDELTGLDENRLDVFSRRDYYKEVVPELIEFTPIAPKEDKDAPITSSNLTGSSNNVSTTKPNEEPAVQTQPESPTQTQLESPTQAQPNLPAKHNLSKPKPISTKSTTTNMKPKPKAKVKSKPKLTTSNTAKTNHTSSKSANKPKPKNKFSSSKVTITKPTNKPQPKSTSMNYAKTKHIIKSSARLASKIVESQDGGHRTSSSSDSYDSVEDSLYRPDPFESSSDSNIDGGISEARKRDLKFKHAPGSAWKKGKEKVLLEDDGIVVESSDEELVLQVGMKFNTKEEFMEAVRDFTIQEGRQIKFRRNESYRVRAVCKWKNEEVKCPWVAYASKDHEETCWKLKTFNNEHVPSPPPPLTRLDKLPHKRRATPSVDPIQGASSGTTSEFTEFMKFVLTPDFKAPKKK
ncbi:hypothetical protein Ahy_A08g039459 [Arachis hypogaea]|uniref:Uncharacterized protein n=1 Tax=Arachis hypogaea TaxID=3818 RepID=A0A445BWD5_ARAHY|nr:hypothetical protein Ahy_A08g039459 [Arachis hypogaea]